MLPADPEEGKTLYWSVINTAHARLVKSLPYTNAQSWARDGYNVVQSTLVGALQGRIEKPQSVPLKMLKGTINDGAINFKPMSNTFHLTTVAQALRDLYQSKPEMWSM